jgi:hypothetical protein
LYVPPSACGEELPESIIVKINGEVVADYTNTGGTQTITNESGVALLITNGIITGVIALADSEDDTYEVEVRCPNGQRIVQQATIGAFPFPDAQMVWYYSWFRFPFSNFATSNYVSVGVPPLVVDDPGSSNPDVELIEVGLWNGGTGSFQNGIFGDLAVRLDGVKFAETITGNLINQVFDVVSENVF